MDIDQATLHFEESGILILNISLAIIMFGVALGIKVDDFKAIAKQPKGAILGMLSQFIFLPALTFVLVLLLEPRPSMALGMFMVAACPGGNVSNFMSSLSKANVALSVTLTAFATALSLLLTPLNFTLYASLYAPTADMLKEFSVNPLDVIPTILLILIVPLVVGMFVAYKFPKFKEVISKPMRIFSILFFLGFLAVMFFKNFDLFTAYIDEIIVLVLLHNGLALMSGYFWGWISGLPQADRRSLAIETGIQNSGLGLAIIFAVFNGLGGMAFVAAWWGIWHIVSGLSLSAVWSRIKPKPNLDGFNPLYDLLHILYGRLVIPNFFRKLDVVGSEQLPTEGGMLMASNHHNAFVDPIVMAAYSGRQTRFLVRADIFEKPIANAALKSLKMWPIYRREDGMETLEKNKAIMEEMELMIGGGGCLTIFPEGTQARESRLRRFRKGIARMGLSAQERLPEGAAPVYIIPVSFNYSNLTEFRADCCLRYGEPICMADYMDLYKEHPAKAYRQIIAELQERIIEGMVHVENLENYEEIINLKDLMVPEHAIAAGKRELRPTESVKAQQTSVRVLNEMQKSEPDAFNQLIHKGLEWKGRCATLGIQKGQAAFTPWSTGKIVGSVLAWLLALPVFLLGWATHLIPAFLVKKMAEGIFKNDMFHMSIKLAAGPLLMFPLFYAIQTTVVWLLLGPWAGLVFLVLLPFLYIGALKLKEWGSRILAEWKYKKVSDSQPEEVEQVRNLQKELVREITSRIE